MDGDNCVEYNNQMLNPSTDTKTGHPKILLSMNFTLEEDQKSDFSIKL